MNRLIKYIYVAFAFTVCLMNCCSLDKKSQARALSSFYDLPDDWRNDLELGHFDSLILKMKPEFRAAIDDNDSVVAAVLGSYITQSFLMLEQRDSFSHYLSQVTPYVKSVEAPQFHCLYHNICGGYYLKYMLNYSMALKHFKSGYSYAEKANNVNIMVAMLSNIVYIFYIRSDKYGMEFARQAERLVAERQADTLARCQAFISMAQMHVLAGNHQKALSYADTTVRLIQQKKVYSLMPLTCLVSAEVYTHSNRPKAADSCYRQAMRYLNNTEPDVASLTLLKYGIFCQEQNWTDKAVSLCEEGLRISMQHGGIEFRRELLRTLADLYYSQKNVREALGFYRQYLFHKDSVADNFVEHEFNNLLLNYQQLEYKHEIQTHKLALLKANQRIGLLIASILMLLLASIFLYWWYKRKQKMYATLVTQYQTYQQRMGKKRPDLFPDEIAGQRESNTLFVQIEELMKTERVYRQNNLSLEVLADMLGSNRTYVSKAINIEAGMPFNAYLNSYRIREAVHRISDLNNDMLMKQLADELGYNSLTVFSKAFQRETGCTPRQYRKTLMEISKKGDNS